MAFAGTQYRDYHKVIRTIEKCSLRATFGPEITSTGKLLPKESSASPVAIHKASHDISTNIVEEQARLTKIYPFSAQARINAGFLPIESANQDRNKPSGLIGKGGIVVLTNQDDNTRWEKSMNRASMPAILTCEDGMKSFRQANFIGQVPLEVWGQKVDELRQCTGTQRIYRDIHDLSYSNHKHPNHDRLWDSKNLFCIGCTKDTMTKCVTCGRCCCFWSICKEIADEPKAGALPQERVKATQWLTIIASLISYGIDEPTFLACSWCQKVLCPKCTSVCEICDALCCPDCCGRCPICQVPKCVHCKPNRKQECSYHKGPSAI